MKILPDEYSSFKQSLLANNSILVYSIPYTGIYFLFIDVKGSFIYIYKAISPKKNSFMYEIKYTCKCICYQI